MLITTGSCCCTPAPFFVYTAYFGNGEIWETDGYTGSFRLLTTLNQVYDIACDPTTGNLYVLDNPGNINGTLYCLDSEGNTLWSTAVSSGAAYNVAVSPDGYVYVVVPADGDVRKFQASDGTEIYTGTGTGSSWYTPPEISAFYTVAVDRDNKVYVGGNSVWPPAVSGRATALGLNSDGTRNWRTKVTNTTDLADSTFPQIVYHLDVFNGEIICQRHGLAATVRSHYIINASTGVIGASARVSNGSANNQVFRGCAYGPSGDDYAVQLPGVAAGAVVLKNLASYLTEPIQNRADGIAISRSGEEIVLFQKVGAVPGCIHNILQGWYVDLGVVRQSTIESSQGRNGPFNT